MKHFLLGAVATILVLVMGGWLYLSLGFAEVAADRPPSAWETSVLSAAVRASVRRRAVEIPNPFAPTDENLVAGGKAYLEGCAGCHGTPGKPVVAGDELYPPIPQLASQGTRYTEAQIFWVTKHGIRLSGMFANGKFDSDDKMWKIAAYVKRIKSLPPQVQHELSKPSGAAGPQ